MYVVEPDTACNVYTFSDTRLTWFSQDISAYYWNYVKKEGVDKNTAIGGDDIEAGKLCFASDSTASNYNKGEVKNYKSAMCGYKFQLTNADTYYDNEFKVMKDSASSLLLGAAAALTAVLAF